MRCRADVFAFAVDEVDDFAFGADQPFRGAPDEILGACIGFDWASGGGAQDVAGRIHVFFVLALTAGKLLAADAHPVDARTFFVEHAGQCRSTEILFIKR